MATMNGHEVDEAMEAILSIDTTRGNRVCNQPATATAAPVVGVALTAEVTVAGSGTGATDLTSVEQASRFCIEVAKSYGAGSLRFGDDEEFGRLVTRYGSLARLQTAGDGNAR
jgi:hypothetical protein